MIQPMCRRVHYLKYPLQWCNLMYWKIPKVLPSLSRFQIGLIKVLSFNPIQFKGTLFKCQTGLLGQVHICLIILLKSIINLSHLSQVLRMRLTDPNRGNDVGKFFLHTNQLLPNQSCRKLETMKIIGVSSESDATATFRVKVSRKWSKLLK